MLIELLLSSTLLSFVKTDVYEVESCNGDKFELINVATPQWPMHTERLTGLGYVDIRVLVDDSGKVTEAVISESVPFRLFDRASMRAVKKWLFNPSSFSERCFDVRFNFDFDEFNGAE